MLSAYLTLMLVMVHFLFDHQVTSSPVDRRFINLVTPKSWNTSRAVSKSGVTLSEERAWCIVTRRPLQVWRCFLQAISSFPWVFRYTIARLLLTLHGFHLWRFWQHSLYFVNIFAGGPQWQSAELSSWALCWFSLRWLLARLDMYCRRILPPFLWCVYIHQRPQAVSI